MDGLREGAKERQGDSVRPRNYPLKPKNGLSGPPAQNS